MGWVVMVRVTSPAVPLAGCTLTQSKARVTAVASAVQSAVAVKETVAVPPSWAMTGAVSSVSGMTMAGSSGSGLGVGLSFCSSSLQAARSRQQKASPADSSRRIAPLLNWVNVGGVNVKFLFHD